MGYYKNQDLEDKLQADLEADRQVTEEWRAQENAEYWMDTISFNRA